jgi:predicted MFS family arabinose efflux permease
LAAYGLGGLLFSATVARLVTLLGARGLARGGGALSGLCFATLALAPNLSLAGLAIGLCGLSFFMLHNVLQTQATQMVPAARGASLALFAMAFFLAQSLGVAVAAPVIDHLGVAPVFATAAIGLPLLGAWMAASLHGRG